MKTKNRKSISIANLLALSLALMAVAQVSPCDARGGGGGGGRGGGGFGGGRSMDGFGDRGFGDRGFGDDRGWGNNGASSFADREPRGNIDDHPAVSEDALRAGANQSYHWGNSLPTDGGFSRGGVNNYGGSTRAIESGTLAGRASSVRSAFNHYDAFGRDWWNRYYRTGWWYPGWGDYWGWGYTGWGDLAGYWDEPASDEPVEYDYGNNITYQGDTVYYGDQPMEPASTYYDQAQTLALSSTPTTPFPGVKAGTTSATVTPAAKTAAAAWKPLGVFALTQGDQTDSNCIFQLAVDKSGVVRGNYYNPMTQEEQPVQGKVDKKNKRVAWTIGSNKQVVYDTGLANLLKPQSSILVHLSRDTTQQWNLVRLKKPASTPAPTQTTNNG